MDPASVSHQPLSLEHAVSLGLTVLLEHPDPRESFVSGGRILLSTSSHKVMPCPKGAAIQKHMSKLLCCPMGSYGVQGFQP